MVEDILRIYGYNNIEIPSAVKSSLTIKGAVDKANKLENIIAEQLVGQGFREILNNSLTKEAYYTKLQVYSQDALVKVLNPLSNDLNVLRQTLLFGGLESIAHNVNRKSTNLRFFESGNCYYFNSSKHVADHTLAAYSQSHFVGLWLTGNRTEGSWVHSDEASSVYELKAYVYNILKRLGCDLKAYKLQNGENDIFGKSLAIADYQGKVLVEFGLVSKSITSQFDLEQEVYYAEINWSMLMKKLSNKDVSYKELPKYPAVKRDLALLVDKNVRFAQIETIAFNSEKKLLKSVELFDVYEGKNLESGKKSYAVSFLLQDETKTMNDKQTDAIMNKIIKNLESQLNAKLR